MDKLNRSFKSIREEKYGSKTWSKRSTFRKKAKISPDKNEEFEIQPQMPAFSQESIKAVEDNFDDDLDLRKMVKVQNRKGKKSGGFQSMGLSYLVLKGIKRKGYQIPTPIQRKTIPLLLEGKDVVAMARTGSGKTAAFLIPLFEKLQVHSSKGVRGLILCPTRELALQTKKFSSELGKYTDINVSVIIGGDSMEEQFSVMHGNPDVLIVTPGRFLHILVEMEIKKLSAIEYVVFDEADRLFEMGFAEQLHEIIRHLPDARQTMLFSATLPKVIVDFAKAGLKDPILIRLDTDVKISENLQMTHLFLRNDDKPALLLHLIQSVIESSEQTVVFVATKHHAEYLHELLGHASVPSSLIYSSLDQTARKMNISNFRKMFTRVLVVTDVAARGIDIPMLDNVINYDFPAKPKLFVHRVGRVARAGRSGRAYSFVTSAEMAYLIDLHLFLGRPLLLNLGTPSSDPKGVLGAVPQASLADMVEYINQAEETAHELASLHRVMENACKQYIKSRSLPSPESLKRSKAMDLSQLLPHPLFVSGGDDPCMANVKLLNELRNFKPSMTVFESKHTRGSRMAEQVMKEKRNFHEAAIERSKIGRASSASGDSAKTSQLSCVSESPTCGFRDENFIPVQPSDRHEQLGFSINSFEREATSNSMEMLADDSKSLVKQSFAKKWDRKRKRFVGADSGKVKKIKTESGGYIPASYKSDLYAGWKKNNMIQGGDLSDQQVADVVDDKLSTRPAISHRKGLSKGRGSGSSKRTQKRELRGKEQILQQRLKKSTQKFRQRGSASKRRPRRS